MFSFFSKKPKFTVRVKEYTTPLLIGGLWTEVHKKTLKKEIGSLQTHFQELRPNLKQLSDPKGTLVISRPAEPDGSFAYFIGELTDTAEQDSSFAVESLACGPYAHISVSFQDPTELTLAVARAKQFFFEKWLPTSGYSVQPDIESVELYDRRSNIALASMELIFPLIKQ